MNVPRLAAATVLALLLGACASLPPPPAPAPAAAEAELAAPESTQAVAGVADAVAEQAEAPAPTVEEDDFAAIYGQPDTAADAGGLPANQDPWENYNRRVHAFNLVFDDAIAQPVARGYAKVVPQPVRRGVDNFFENLGAPLTLVNLMLQGRAKEAWDTLGRFLMNTTLGVGGLFDPASRAGVARHDADFGQTFAIWGWRRSRYFELPFLGPRTLRDAFGMPADMQLSPTRELDSRNARYALKGLDLLETRASLLPLEDLRRSAPDEYVLVRDAWLQRRNYQIQSRLQGDGDAGEQDPALLPEYLREPGLD